MKSVSGLLANSTFSGYSAADAQDWVDSFMKPKGFPSVVGEHICKCKKTYKWDGLGEDLDLIRDYYGVEYTHGCDNEFFGSAMHC